MARLCCLVAGHHHDGNIAYEHRHVGELYGHLCVGEQRRRKSPFDFIRAGVVAQFVPSLSFCSMSVGTRSPTGEYIAPFPRTWQGLTLIPLSVVVFGLRSGGPRVTRREVSALISVLSSRWIAHTRVYRNAQVPLASGPMTAHARSWRRMQPRPMSTALKVGTEGCTRKMID